MRKSNISIAARLAADNPTEEKILAAGGWVPRWARILHDETDDRRRFYRLPDESFIVKQADGTWVARAGIIQVQDIDAVYTSTTIEPGHYKRLRGDADAPALEPIYRYARKSAWTDARDIRWPESRDTDM